MGRGLVVIYDDKMLQLNKTSNTRLRALYEGGSGIVLTIGDGDFSFSAALQSQFNLKASDGSQRLLATSYDSQAQVMQKYPSTAGVCLDTLKRMNIPILHNIDATKLYQTLEVNRYRMMKRPDTLPIPNYIKNCSRIIFNFPNLGNLGPDSIQIHQNLLKNFFIQCLPLLIRPNIKNGGERGEVHVALRNTPFYEKWNIEQMAISIGYKLLEKDVFKTENYPGYEEQRTNPGILRAAPPKAEGASIYRFIIDDQYIDHLEASGYMDVKPIDVSNLNAYTKSIMPTEVNEECDMESPDVPLFDQGNHDFEHKVNKMTQHSSQLTPSTNVQPPLSDASKFNIQSYQIVDIKLDTSTLKQSKLPTFTPTNLPTGVIQYYPIYPHCPNVPTLEEINKGGDQLKKYQPIGLFTSLYHNTLNKIDTKSRNFRLGLQDLFSTLGKGSDGVKEQLKSYTNEALVNGTILLRISRANEHEKFYRQEYIAAHAPKIEPTAKKKAVITTKTMKKMVNGKLVNVKVQVKEPIEQQSNQKNDKWDLPPDQRLYIGYVVGILTPESARASDTHINTEPAKNSSTNQTNLGKKVIVVKTAVIRKATSQNIDLDDGDEQVSHKAKRILGNNMKEIAQVIQEPVPTESTQQQKPLNKSSRLDQIANSNEIAEEDLAEFLGADTNSLAFQMATADAGGYKLSFKEKEQIRLQNLKKANAERVQKKNEWQAERRVKHAEERGKQANARDLALVNSVKKDKEEKKIAKHNRKQQRRIDKDTNGDKKK